MGDVMKDYCSCMGKSTCVRCFRAFERLATGNAEMHCKDFLGDGCEKQREKRKARCVNLSQFSTSPYEDVTEAAIAIHKMQVAMWENFPRSSGAS
jgi:ABC-type polar amino acid transport system ATPase subunit